MLRINRGLQGDRDLPKKYAKLAGCQLGKPRGRAAGEYGPYWAISDNTIIDSGISLEYLLEIARAIGCLAPFETVSATEEAAEIFRR